MTTTSTSPLQIVMWMGLGMELVKHIADTVDREPQIARLVAALSGRHVGFKCDPQADSGLGYLLVAARVGRVRLAHHVPGRVCAVAR